MTFSLVGIAPGSDATLPFAGHYEMLRTIKHFASGQLVVDSTPPAALATSIKTKSVMSPSAPEELWTLTYGAHRVALSLVNPGAETGSTSGWSSVAQLSVVTDKPNVTGPNSGTYFFAPSSLAAATASQTIDLLADGILAADLDAGIVDVAVRWFQTGDTGNSDGVYFNIDYLDAFDVSISLDDNAGSAVSETTNNWTEKLQKGRCPVGTRKIIIIMHMPDGGDAYVDDITVHANENRFGVVGATSGAQAQLIPGIEYDNGFIRCTVDDVFTHLLNQIYVLSVTNGIRTLYQTNYVGTGNGKLTFMELIAKQAEIWTLTCTAAAADGGTFSVVGSVSGAQADATVGVLYDNGIIRLLINDSTTDFAVNDVFTLTANTQELPLADRWQLLRYDDSTDDHELIMLGNGIVGRGQVYVGIRTIQDVAGDYYNLVFSTMEGYVSGNTYGTQPNITHKTMPLWQSDINYWLRITQRQIYLGVDLGGLGDLGGSGFFLAYYDPGIYPYVSSTMGSLSGISTTRFSDTSRRFGPDQGVDVVWMDSSIRSPRTLPYATTFWNTNVLEPTDTAEVTNYIGTGDGTLFLPNKYLAAPRETWSITAINATTFSVVGSISGVQANATVGVLYDNGLIRFTVIAGAISFVAADEFTLVFDRQYALEKVVINDNDVSYGELEGIHFVGGFAIAALDTIIDDNANTHIVLNSVNRTGFRDFATLILD